MGLLVEGVWRDEWYDTSASGGKFERPATSYRDWIKAGGRFSPRPAVRPPRTPSKTENAEIDKEDHIKEREALPEDLSADELERSD